MKKLFYLHKLIEPRIFLSNENFDLHLTKKYSSSLLKYICSIRQTAKLQF